MQFYEYKVTPFDLTQKVGTIESAMNEMGKDLWEMVSSNPAPGGKVFVFWRRELSNAPGIKNVEVKTNVPHIPGGR